MSVSCRNARSELILRSQENHEARLVSSEGG